MPAILIVDGNEALTLALSASLQVEGYTVDAVPTGSAALAWLASAAPHLVILDLTLNDMSGFEVLRGIRESGCDTPVLVLSARDQEVDKVQSFRLGADDYVVKPAGMLELLARVAALLRRAMRQTAGESSPAREPLVQRIGDIDVDPVRRTIRRGSQLIDVRPMEFELLLHLLAARGQVVTRRTLMQNVWHYSPEIATRTVDQHINRLRQRLDDDPVAPRYIATVRKAGYRALI